MRLALTVPASLSKVLRTHQWCRALGHRRVELNDVRSKKEPYNAANTLGVRSQQVRIVTECPFGEQDVSRATSFEGHRPYAMPARVRSANTRVLLPRAANLNSMVIPPRVRALAFMVAP